VTDDMMTMHYCIIIVCTNDNKAVIKNIIMEDSKTLFWSSKFPWAHERISWKLIGNFSTRPHKVSPALVQTAVGGRYVVCQIKTTDTDTENWLPVITKNVTNLQT
jgi:hypothetical protein